MQICYFELIELTRMVCANWHRYQRYQNLPISCVHCNCGMQDAMKQTLSIKVGQHMLNNVQTAQLWAAHPSLVVWSAIMKPLKGLGQSTSVMMVLFWWRRMRTQESVGVMACGMEAYPSVFQVHIVANSFQFRMGICINFHLYGKGGFIWYACTYPANPKPILISYSVALHACC